MTQSRSIDANISYFTDETKLNSFAESTVTSTSVGVKEEEEEKKLTLFGEPQGEKRRKFILVDDQARGCRVRVRALLDNVKMEEMPDSHLRANSLYPRSYFPRQMRSSPHSPSQSGFRDVSEDSIDNEANTSEHTGIRDRLRVRVLLLSGSYAHLHIPQPTKGRRARECALNELGYRMSWGQAKTFNERPIFLQKACKLFLS